MNEIVQNEKWTVSETHITACKIHSEIIANGEIAATALINVMKNLKIMRDEKLYTELGYNDFDSYVETAVGIKKRQAYTYITTYERIANTPVLQSTAQFGITKLELIANIPPTEREEFITENDIENMSTRELKEATEKLKNLGEQISLLQSDNDESITEIQQLQNKIKELESKPIDVAVQEPTEEQLNKIKKQVEKDLKKQFEQDKQKILDEQKNKLKSKFDKELQLSTMQNQTAEQKIKELEKKTNAGASEKEIFKIYFDGLQTDLKHCLEFIENIKDSNVKSTFKNAMQQYINMTLQALEK